MRSTPGITSRGDRAMSFGIGVLLGGDSSSELLTEKVGAKEIGLGAGTWATSVGYAAIAGETAFLSGLSLMLLTLGVAFAISYVNHLIAWGLCRKPCPEVDDRDLLCLDRLLWLQLPVVLAWLGFGALLALHPQATVPILPFHVPWLSILIPVLIPGVLVTVVASSAKAKKAGLGFITEAVRGSPAARFLEGLITPLERVLLLRPLREWLRGKELGLVSGFSIFLISTLLFFGTEAVYGIAAQRMVRDGVEHIFPSKQQEDEPTYEELCPGGGEPGDPAPGAWRHALYGLWLGEYGAGAVEAGCTGTAHPAKGHPHIWVAEGMCEGSLRSYAIAAKGRAASLLYQQAARFAVAKEEAGVLLGASPRQDLRDGDFYLVETEIGPYVLIRSQKATGSTTAEGIPRRCEDYTSDNYPYTSMPPGLLQIWLQISRWQLAWPVSEESASPGKHGFVFLGADTGEVIAHAECESPTYCTASFHGRVLATPTVPSPSLEAILRVVRIG